MIKYRIFNLSRYLIFLILGCLIWGCSRKSPEYTDWRAPSWTPDGKIIFMEHYYHERYMEGLVGSYDEGGREEVWLCEINSDGTNLRKVKKIVENTFFGMMPGEIGLVSTSCAGDWIAFNIEDNRGDNHLFVIYVIKKDGTELQKVVEGLYPDFSPDASKIVYKKLNQGIWVINRDGTNDHRIVNTPSQQTAWSPNVNIIGYDFSDTLFLIDSLGNTIQKLLMDKRSDGPDWGNSNDTVSLYNGLDSKPRLLSLASGKIDTLNIIVGGFLRWSPSGNYFIGHDENGYLIIKRDGTNKWYLNP